MERSSGSKRKDLWDAKGKKILRCKRKDLEEHNERPLEVK
jgi:hypothetical protein